MIGRLLFSAVMTTFLAAGVSVSGPAAVFPPSFSPIRHHAGVKKSSPSANQVGHVVLASVLRGDTVAGVIVHESRSTVWIRPLFRHQPPKRLRVSPVAVIWRGGWRFVGDSNLRGMRVNMVVTHKEVLGVLAYQSGYGRVVDHRGSWVRIRRLRGKIDSNPACRTATGPAFRARLSVGTVWNSTEYVLPPKSLVQYTVYGIPGFPYMLGGVEDYGPAPCRVRTPKTSAVFLGSSLGMLRVP
jgi:hypothetical protein